MGGETGSIGTRGIRPFFASSAGLLMMMVMTYTVEGVSPFIIPNQTIYDNGSLNANTMIVLLDEFIHLDIS